jgi:hypothetical protein
MSTHDISKGQCTVPLLESKKIDIPDSKYEPKNLGFGSGKKVGLDLLFLKRLLSLEKILMSPAGTLLSFFILLATSVVQVFVVSYTGTAIGGFYGAIIANDKQGI